MAPAEGIEISAGDAGGYFQIMQRALAALDEILREEKPGPWGDRPNRVTNAVAMAHLARLRRNFVAWDMKRMFTDRFTLDSVESGFPVYRNVLELERDQERVEERLAEIPDAATIRREMLDLILKFKQHPGALQKTMAERLYLEALRDGAAFPAFQPPETVRVSLDRRTGRLVYVVHWAAYDGTENLPLVYLAVIEDSVGGRARADILAQYHEAAGKGGMARIAGLPNAALTDSFQAFAANHAHYGLTLTSIATALDSDFSELHPKQLRRFVLGPFYGAGQTRHPDAVQRVLDSAKLPEESWIMTWTMQELISQRQIPAKHGIWSKEPAREIFYIDTDDVECVQQGVSAFTRYALVPHDVYQAVFASGIAGSVFSDHECAVLSGNEILRNL